MGPFGLDRGTFSGLRSILQNLLHAFHDVRRLTGDFFPQVLHLVPRHRLQVVATFFHLGDKLGILAFCQSESGS